MKTIALCTAVLSIVSLPLCAAESSDDWRWNLGISAFFPELSGMTRFTDVTSGNGVALEIEDILENGEFTAIAELSVKRGRLGAFADAMYMNLDASEEESLSLIVDGSGVPANEAARVNLEVEGIVWTVGGSYTVNDDAKHSVDMVVGGRVIDIEQSIRWQLSGDASSIPVAARNGNLKAELQNWDFIVGARSRITSGANSNWAWSLYIDGGKGESDYTWLAIVGLGYSFEWGEIQAAWRTLEYELRSESAVESLSFNGPELKVVFRL